MTNPTTATEQDQHMDTIEISAESRKRFADESYQGPLDIGLARWREREAAEKATTEELDPVPMAMHAAPVCPRFFWPLFLGIIALIGAVVCGVACLLGWAVA